jgi:hypothetical protein
MISRALPDRSVRELIDTKARLGKELRASGYLYEDKTFIFSAITGITECGPVLVHNISDSDEQLGTSICDKLLEFGLHDPGDPRECKPTDWIAYIASGAKSVKHFEAHALYFGFETVNSAIVYRAKPRLSLESSFYAGATLSNGHQHEI